MGSFLVFIFGGLLACIGLVIPALSLLIIPATGFWFLGSQRAQGTTRAALGGLIFGLLAGIGGIWWMVDALPLSWLSIPEPLQIPFVSTVMAVTAFSLALPFAFGSCLVRILPLNAWYTPLSFGFLLAGVEVVRPFCFSLFFLAPGIPVNGHFSVAALGYVLMEIPFLSPLALTGITGLSVFLGALGALFAQLLVERSVPIKSSVLLVIILFTLHLALPSSQENESQLRIGLVNSYFPAGNFSNPEEIIRLIKVAGSGESDVIVVPEGYGLAKFLTEEDRKKLYTDAFGNRGGLIIDSSTVRDATGLHSRIVYWSTERGEIATQDKIFLAPIGEYFPPLIHRMLTFSGEEALLGYRAYTNPIRSGTGLSTALFKGRVFGGLLCSELLSPWLYRELTHDHGAQVLVNLANNSWFHNSRLLHHRLIQIARVHAIQNNSYMLVSANGSPSFAIDPGGLIIAEGTWGSPGVVFATISVPIP